MVGAIERGGFVSSKTKMPREGKVGIFDAAEGFSRVPVWFWWLRLERREMIGAFVAFVANSEWSKSVSRGSGGCCGDRVRAQEVGGVEELCTKEQKRAEGALEADGD